MHSETPTYCLEHHMAQELHRLADCARAIEDHLDVALSNATLDEATITGMQQLDQMYQVLNHLGALMDRWADKAPMDPSAARVLASATKLESLKARLLAESEREDHTMDIDMF